MKRRACLSVAAVLAAAVLVGSQVLSQDKGPKGREDQETQIREMMEMAAPGKFHDCMKPLAGSWNCSVKYWPAPGAEPHESTATMEKKWVLDGRFLTEEYEGTIFNNVPFAVFGIMGYDKTQKKYFVIHMDTTSTGFETAFGACDASCQVFTFRGDKKSDPWDTLEIVNNDKNISKAFRKGPDGKAWMFLEIIATRK